VKSRGFGKLVVAAVTPAKAGIQTVDVRSSSPLLLVNTSERMHAAGKRAFARWSML